MIIVNTKDGHFVVAVRAVQGIIPKGQKYVITPLCKALQKRLLGGVHRFIEWRIVFTMSGIKTIIPCHFEIPIRDVLNQQLHKVKYRKCLPDEYIILMAVIVESDLVAVIGVNPF